MEKGTIQKMLDYYFTKPQFREEILRAMREFFNRPDLAPGGKLELKEEDEGGFNEWFIFDFKLSNGRSPLEDFYENNPCNLKMDKLQAYKDLRDSHYGFYRVLNVKKGKGLTLENLQTGKIYEVKEYAATFELEEEKVFIGRVGKVGEHYEIVGSNPTLFPFKVAPSAKEMFRKWKDGLNPKIVRDVFLSKRGSSDLKPEDKFPTLKGAEDNFKEILEKYELNKFINTELIKEWIYNHTGVEAIPTKLNIILGLLYPDMENYGKAIQEITENFNYFYNLCPQKELGDISPSAKKRERDEKGKMPNLRISYQQFPGDWGKNYHKALEYMKEAKFKAALKEFNKVFSCLLKNKTTYPEIYRLYANKGVCHFALGQIDIGEFMLKISVELNSLYDFAKQQLAKYKEIKNRFRKTEKKDLITEDIGYKYYQFLKKFEINFNHPLREPPAIINIKRKK